MANEREVREGTKPSTQRRICSVTGDDCECGSNRGCAARRYRSPVDPLPTSMVQELATACIYLDAAVDRLDSCIEVDDYQRAYPGSEVRDIRRKITAAKAMIEELT